MANMEEVFKLEGYHAFFAPDNDAFGLIIE